MSNLTQWEYTREPTADFNGYHTPVYQQPCRCNDCPTCGRPRSWWPWNWYWPGPSYQFPAADRADWSFTNAASATA